VSREYGPGDRLPAERELALQLELSRPALREGIRRLRSGGVLESRRGSGTYVAEVDLDGVYDIRLRLEPFAAERAAQARTDRELEEMLKAVSRMHDYIDDSETFNIADARFHSLVAGASRSSVLRGTLDRLSELALLTRTVVAPNERSRRVALSDVERVLAAIERQHPKRAANAMERHIHNVRDDYLRMVANGRAPVDDTDPAS
jgi:DNA-binding FadR family transcriptional regulator